MKRVFHFSLQLLFQIIFTERNISELYQQISTAAVDTVGI
jgi:hypothetical protein